MDWVNLTLPTRESQGDPQISSEPTEEIKHDISSLAARFTAWIRKQAASAQGETTPYFGVPGGKRPKRLGLNEEVQKSLIVIISDSLERAFDALSALESVAQDASRESFTSSEDGTPSKGPPNANKVMGDAPSIETVVGPPIYARRSNTAIASPRRPRGPNMLVLNSPIQPMKWDHLLTETYVPGLDAA